MKELSDLENGEEMQISNSPKEEKREKLYFLQIPPSLEEKRRTVGLTAEEVRAVHENQIWPEPKFKLEETYFPKEENELRKASTILGKTLKLPDGDYSGVIKAVDAIKFYRLAGWNYDKHTGKPIDREFDMISLALRGNFDDGDRERKDESVEITDMGDSAKGIFEIVSTFEEGDEIDIEFEKREVSGKNRYKIIEFEHRKIEV